MLSERLSFFIIKSPLYEMKFSSLHRIMMTLMTINISLRRQVFDANEWQKVEVMKDIE